MPLQLSRSDLISLLKVKGAHQEETLATAAVTCDRLGEYMRWIENVSSGNVRKAASMSISEIVAVLFFPGAIIKVFLKVQDTVVLKLSLRDTL